MSDDWKKEPVSKKQSDFIASLGYKGTPPKNKGEASDIINKLQLKKLANELRDNVNYTLSDEADKIIDNNIGLYSSVLIKCVDIGIQEPAVIGMLYNNVKEDLRSIS